MSELLRRAQIRLGRGESAQDWQRVLRRHIRSRARRRALLGLLSEQVSHLGRYQPEVRSRTWLTAGGVRVFGGSVASLLRRVAETGSLPEAAPVCGIRHPRVAGLLETAQRHLGVPLVRQHGVGRAALTEQGHRWLALYSRWDAEVAAFASRRFSALCAERELP
ncbi:winged helix-turn-helix domain-containing protein [Myxococcota bacterium]